jgi:large subunit ribosomal protein L2
VDFSRKTLNKIAICISLTKEANRNSFLALIKYSNGAYSYILAPHGIINGYILQTLTNPLIFSSDYKIGSHIFLKNIPPRSIFFNLELKRNCGGIYARSAGVYCILLSKDSDKNIAKIRLPSSKHILISLDCMATLGRSSNLYSNKQIIGKAGRNVLSGQRPSVRGVAMNPVDHPHGGRTKTNSPELTPWGKIAKFNK